LDDDEIQAFYSLPGDYPTNRVVILVYYKSPNWEIQEFFGDLLRTNLLAGLPDDLVARVIDQPEITIHAMETGRIFPNSTPSLGLLVPAFAVLIYMFSIFPIAELLAGTLGDEKTNRTIEMIMTSIRTNELIIGKLSAAAILLLMQIAVWVILIIGLVWLGRFTLNEAWLWDVRIVWRDLGQIILLAISGLIFYGSVLVFAGAMFSQEEDVRQAASLVILPLFLPVYILPIIIEDSGSLMAQIFSLVPITSVQTMGIQLMFAPLPGWKVLLATGLNLGGAALFSWLAVRVFRSGMLRYGKRLRLKDLFKRQAKQGGTGVP
jgi:ABC-2 type transport system permease protein